jgi:hypothetical protein
MCFGVADLVDAREFLAEGGPEVAGTAGIDKAERPPSWLAPLSEVTMTIVFVSMSVCSRNAIRRANCRSA